MSLDATFHQYDDIFDSDRNCKAEAAFVADRLIKHGVAGRGIMHLGCGTGGHAVELASAGFSVCGVDLDGERVARAEARRVMLPKALAERLRFQQGDARTVRTAEVYDAVVSLFHVASYQITNSEFMAMCHTAALHLPRAGIFLFDCWYGPAILSDPPQIRINRSTNDALGILRIAEPLMRPHENTVQVDYTFILTDFRTNATETVLGTHVMRYMFRPEIELMLDLSGFEVLDSMRSLGGELNPSDASVTFVARKR
jgi:SAM-dependent methyltransferase